MHIPTRLVVLASALSIASAIASVSCSQGDPSATNADTRNPSLAAGLARPPTRPGSNTDALACVRPPPPNKSLQPGAFNCQPGNPDVIAGGFDVNNGTYANHAYWTFGPVTVGQATSNPVSFFENTSCPNYDIWIPDGWLTPLPNSSPPQVCLNNGHTGVMYAQGPDGVYRSYANGVDGTELTITFGSSENGGPGDGGDGGTGDDSGCDGGGCTPNDNIMTAVLNDRINDVQVVFGYPYQDYDGLQALRRANVYRVGPDGSVLAASRDSMTWNAGNASCPTDGAWDPLMLGSFTPPGGVDGTSLGGFSCPSSTSITLNGIGGATPGTATWTANTNYQITLGENGLVFQYAFANGGLVDTDYLDVVGGTSGNMFSWNYLTRTGQVVSNPYGGTGNVPAPVVGDVIMSANQGAPTTTADPGVTQWDPEPETVSPYQTLPVTWSRNGHNVLTLLAGRFGMLNASTEGGDSVGIQYDTIGRETDEAATQGGVQTAHEWVQFNPANGLPDFIKTSGLNPNEVTEVDLANNGVEPQPTQITYKMNGNVIEQVSPSYAMNNGFTVVTGYRETLNYDQFGAYAPKTVQFTVSNGPNQASASDTGGLNLNQVVALDSLGRASQLSSTGPLAPVNNVNFGYGTGGYVSQLTSNVQPLGGATYTDLSQQTLSQPGSIQVAGGYTASFTQGGSTTTYYDTNPLMTFNWPASGGGGGASWSMTGTVLPLGDSVAMSGGMSDPFNASSSVQVTGPGGLNSQYDGGVSIDPAAQTYTGSGSTVVMGDSRNLGDQGAL
jgi:hypothetical protein